MKKSLIAVLIILILLPGLVKAEDSGIIKYFNGECLGFAVIENVSTVCEDMKKTGLGEIWNEQEVREFLAAPFKAFDEMIGQATEATGFDINALISLVKRVEKGAGAGILSVDLESEMPELAFIIKGISKEDQEIYQEMTGRLEEMITQAGEVNVSKTVIQGQQVTMLKNPKKQRDPVVCYIKNPDEIILTITQSAMVKILENAAKQEYGVQLKKAMTHCSLGERGGLFAYADMQAVSALLKQGVAMEEGEDSEEYRGVSAIHLEDFTSIAFHASISPPGFYDRIYIGLTDTPRGLGKLFKQNPLPDSAIGSVPNDVAAFNAFYLDPVNLWDTILTFIKEVNPQQAAQVEAGIQMFEQPLGLKVRDGLLASFSGDFLFYQRFPMGLMPQQMPEIVIKASLKTSEPMKKFFAWLIPLVTMNAGQNVQIKEEKVGEQDVTFVHVAQFRMLNLIPGFAITDSALIIGTNRAAVQGALSGPVSDITANPEYKKLGEYVKDNDASGITFNDMKKTFGRLYTVLGQFAAMMPNIGRKTGLDMTKLPLTETITKHLSGVKNVTRKVAGGVFIEMYGPVEVVTVAGGIGLGAGVYGFKQQQAFRGGRERAEDVPVAETVEVNTGTENKLRELYNACRIYSFDNNGKFPSKLSELYPDYVLELSLFSAKGKKVTRDTIDSDGMFIIVPGVSPTDDENTVLIHERVAPGADTVKAICISGTVKSVSVGDLKKKAAK